MKKYVYKPTKYSNRLNGMNVTGQIKAGLNHYQTNLKIRQSEANLQAIFNSTIDEYLLLDDTYQVIAFNERARLSAHLNKNYQPFIIGRSIFDYIEQTGIEHFKQILADLELGGPISYERQFDLNGEKLWMYYTLTAVHHENNLKGVCINGRNITEFKNHVQTIESHNAILRSISWAQSHLVRAPLARIMALTPQLMDCNDEGERQELLKYLELSCNELDRVIKNIVRVIEPPVHQI
jgi:PAS domain S-box-containing protein